MFFGCTAAVLLNREAVLARFPPKTGRHPEREIRQGRAWRDGSSGTQVLRAVWLLLKPCFSDFSVFLSWFLHVFTCHDLEELPKGPGGVKSIVANDLDPNAVARCLRQS